MSTSGTVATSSAIPVTLSTTGSADVWRVSVAGESLAGEVAMVKGDVQGWLRGSALGDPVRLSAGETPDAAFAFEGTPERDRYAGTVIVGLPRFEGIGAASRSVTTCASNGFTLKRA